jgi:hypothetical protein
MQETYAYTFPFEFYVIVMIVDAGFAGLEENFWSFVERISGKP